MKKIQLKFYGIDYFNRPVYKDVNSKNYYGSANVLFPDRGIAPNNTIEEINDYFRNNIFQLCYFGTSFNCEPYGGSLKNIELIII